MLFSPVIIPTDLTYYSVVAHPPSYVKTLLTQYLFNTLWQHFYTTSILTYTSSLAVHSIFTPHHFHISDISEPSPIEALTTHLFLKDWPESHIPIFIPIDKSNFDCVNSHIGSVALVPKVDFSEVTFAVAA